MQGQKGIDDTGNLIGIDNVDETYTRLTNGIRDAIAPDVTMFVRYVLWNNKVIQIEVAAGRVRRNDRRGSAGTAERQEDESLSARPSDE